VQAVGLQTYIWANNRRSIYLLAAFPVLLLVLTFAVELVLMGMGALPSYPSLGQDFAYAAGLMAESAPLAIIVAGVWFVIAYLSNQAIIDLATGARVIERQDNPELYNLLENLCISRGLKTPTLRLIDDPDLNAFATGLHEGQFSITVTQGLLEVMDRDELEAVLGHELTHIINRDVRTMVIAAVFAGIISLVAQIISRMIWFRGGRDDEERRDNGLLMIIGVAAAAIAGLLAVVVRMALSRDREYVADAGSVELTKNADAMISALQKIDGRAHLDAPEEIRGLFLENQEEGIWGLFATHPPIEKRIEALVKYAGGQLHEPPPLVVSSQAAPVLDTPASGPWGDRPVGPWG
jgi:heat shock protein HtpX